MSDKNLNLEDVLIFEGPYNKMLAAMLNCDDDLAEIFSRAVKSIKNCPEGATVLERIKRAIPARKKLEHKLGGGRTCNLDFDGISFGDLSFNFESLNKGTSLYLLLSPVMNIKDIPEIKSLDEADSFCGEQGGFTFSKETEEGTTEYSYNFDVAKKAGSNKYFLIMKASERDEDDETLLPKTTNSVVMQIDVKDFLFNSGTTAGV